MLNLQDAVDSVLAAYHRIMSANYQHVITDQPTNERAKSIDALTYMLKWVLNECESLTIMAAILVIVDINNITEEVRSTHLHQSTNQP